MSRDSRISHAHFAALRLKDAIADHFRERSGRRPDVDTEHPDVWINLVIRRDQALISLDTSGRLAAPPRLPRAVGARRPCRKRWPRPWCA